MTPSEPTKLSKTTSFWITPTGHVELIRYRGGAVDFVSLTPVEFQRVAVAVNEANAKRFNEKLAAAHRPTEWPPAPQAGHKDILDGMVAAAHGWKNAKPVQPPVAKPGTLGPTGVPPGYVPYHPIERPAMTVPKHEDLIAIHAPDPGAVRLPNGVLVDHDMVRASIGHAAIIEIPAAGTDLSFWLGADVPQEDTAFFSDPWA